LIFPVTDQRQQSTGKHRTTKVITIDEIAEIIEPVLVDLAVGDDISTTSTSG
jgi:hypothetical protein